MRAALDAAAITDGSSTAIGTSTSRPLTHEIERDPERQRVDADGVLDDPVGGRRVDAAAVQRPQVLLRQFRVQAQQPPPLLDGQSVETRNA